MNLEDYKKTVYTVPSNTANTLFIGVSTVSNENKAFVTISEQTSNDGWEAEYELDISMDSETARLAASIFFEIAEQLEAKTIVTKSLSK